MMNKADIEFLIELQKELKNQETDCQAEPRFWGIIEDDRIYGLDIKNGCDWMLRIGDNSFDDIKEAMEYLLDYYDEDITENDLSSIYNFDDLKELLENKGYDDVDIIGYDTEQKLSNQTGCFLTKKACKEHLRLNDYHYKNGRTYAMTAWRNPEFGRVLKILTETDWSKLLKE